MHMTGGCPTCGDTTQERILAAQQLVDRQAEDAALWFVGPERTAPEAYLQAALRDMHAAVEALAGEAAKV